MIKSGRERRKHLRLDKKLPFKVAVDGYDFSTTTENISCVGAYCQIKKYIPPFTKVMVKLSLPIKVNNNSKTHTIDCEGVIVRTEDKDKTGFNIAIFFNQIKDNQRKVISEYINQFVPQGSSAPRPPKSRWGK
ncbi:MAG: PilZ domain-containing protein [Candidatus Omnitrophica bacterium]|nr:PilZ domain-containing protein [Candidatus Omnitrophota bacterium]